MVNYYRHDMKNEREILESIVEHDGSCTWSNKSTCAKCPMSRLRARKNGGHYSCIEAICAQELSEEEADKRYKKVAALMLADLDIEDMLIKE